MNLLEAAEGIKYTVVGIDLDDSELTEFLFSLGCYEGETVTVISRLRNGCIVAIKDGRYTVDKALASAISVREDTH
jgi:ferrous iron transport protein A